MATVKVIVTGHREIDRKLVKFPLTTQKALTRRALRKTAKKVQDQFKSEVGRAGLVDTGAYQQSTSIRALKRSRNRIGVRVFIDRNRLVKVRQRRIKVIENKALKRLVKNGLSEETQGRIEALTERTIATKQADAEKVGFYPAVYEFGTSERPADKPLRKALYSNTQFVKQAFADSMKEVLREVFRD